MLGFMSCNNQDSVELPLVCHLGHSKRMMVVLHSVSFTIVVVWFLKYKGNPTISSHVYPANLCPVNLYFYGHRVLTSQTYLMCMICLTGICMTIQFRYKITSVENFKVCLLIM